MAVLIAYLRACNGGGEKRIGVEIQRAAVEDWARRRRHQLAAIISENPSAASLEDRQALAEALAALHQGVAQGLVVYGLDCLDSALVVQEQLLAEVRATGARVYSLQPDDAAELRRIPADPSRQGVRDVLRAAAANQPQMAASFPTLPSRQHWSVSPNCEPRARRCGRSPANSTPTGTNPSAASAGTPKACDGSWRGWSPSSDKQRPEAFLRPLIRLDSRHLAGEQPTRSCSDTSSRRGFLRCGFLRRGFLRRGLLRYGLLRYGFLCYGLGPSHHVC